MLAVSALAVSLLLATSDGATPPTPRADKVPVLIVTGANNHDWQYTTPRIREALERSGRFTVDVTDKAAQTLGDKNAIAKYACLVLNYNGPRWGEPAETNFLDAVRNGTGVTVIHAANNAFTDWPEYMKLVGDMWILNVTGHGAYHTFDVKMTDHEHPITRGMPDLVGHPDELYHNLVRTEGVAVKVLATAFDDPDPKIHGTGKDELMVTVHEYGKGRVFHTPLGHVWPGKESEGTRATWDDSMLGVLVARGTEWAATGAVTIPPRPINALTLAEQKEGFRLLFDGTTTKGWRSYRGQAFPTKGWSVEDGALHAAKEGGGGDVVTSDAFADFELRFEWKVAPGSNSGVMYHTGEELDYPWQTAPEYQILDDAVHPDGKNPATSAASLYALYAPAEKTLMPVGDWNESRIVVNGKHIEHWLNNKKVVECELDSADWKAKVAASKFASMPKFATVPKGPIDLQDHGDEVWYRSIRVRELAR
jgi:type 1 glutamine amidotransferase